MRRLFISVCGLPLVVMHWFPYCDVWVGFPTCDTWVLVVMHWFPYLWCVGLFPYLWCIGSSCDASISPTCDTWVLVVTHCFPYLWYMGSSCGTSVSLLISLLVMHGFCSCSAWNYQNVAPQNVGLLIPWPGIEPASPALEGGFLTTGPLGKSLSDLFHVA